MAEITPSLVKESNWGSVRKIQYVFSSVNSADQYLVYIPGYIGHWIVSGGNPGVGAGPSTGVVVGYYSSDGTGAFTFSTTRSNVPVRMNVLVEK